MASYRWGLICSGAADSTGSPGRLDLHGVLDEFHVGGLDAESANSGIAVQVDLTVVTVWHRDDWERPEHAEMRLVFCNPGGERLAESNEQVLKLDAFPIVRLIGKIPIWPIKGGFGVYSLGIEFRAQTGEQWKHVGDIRMGVWQAPPGATSNAATQGVART